MNGADLIARILKKEGVDILPAFPHSDLIDSAAKVGIRPIIVRQERQALHIADGYARVTGGRRIACTTVQYGPPDRRTRSVPWRSVTPTTCRFSTSPSVMPATIR